MKWIQKNIFWLLLGGANFAVLAGALWFLTSDRDFSMNQKKNSWIIGQSYMTMNNEFYTIMSEEINARIEAARDRHIFPNPALGRERPLAQSDEMLDQ